MQDIVLDELGNCELLQIADILKSLAENGTPKGLDGGLKIGFNKRSGLVYLYDENYSSAAMCFGRLEKIYYLEDSGLEDFCDELVANFYNGYVDTIDDLTDLLDACREQENDAEADILAKIEELKNKE